VGGGRKPVPGQGENLKGPCVREEPCDAEMGESVVCRGRAVRGGGSRGWEEQRDSLFWLQEKLLVKGGQAKKNWGNNFKKWKLPKRRKVIKEQKSFSKEKMSESEFLPNKTTQTVEDERPAKAQLTGRRGPLVGWKEEQSRREIP